MRNLARSPRSSRIWRIPAGRHFRHALKLVLFGILVCEGAAAFVYAQPPASVKGAPPTADTPPAAAAKLNKAAALQATINALALNGSDAAWNALRKIVAGEVDTGDLDVQATRLALTHWIQRGSEQSDAFLLEALIDAEKVRPAGKGTYLAADLRKDLAEMLALSASLGLREKLADRMLDPATSAEAKAAAAEILKAPRPDNIPLQVRLISSDTVDASLKAELTNSLASTNAAIVQQALGTIVEPKAPAAAALPKGNPAIPSGTSVEGLPGLPPGNMPPGGIPFGSAGPIPSAGSLPGSKMGRGLFGALKRVFGNDASSGSDSATSTEPAELAKVMWSAKFAGSLSKQISKESSSRASLLGFLASLPSRPGRTELYAFLDKHWAEGPAELAGAKKADVVTDADFGAKPLLGRKGGKRGKDDDDAPRAPLVPTKEEPVKPENHIPEFGGNWFDPGALVVLKSFPYVERPAEKLSRKTIVRPGSAGAANNPAGNTPRPKSAAAQKRDEEREARQKALEMRYDWRDAIERYVHVLSERFQSAGTEPVSSEDAASTKDSSKPDDADPKRGTATAKKNGDEKPAKALAPSHGLPFAVHPGAKVVKMFQGDWPAASGPGKAVADPMNVRYVRIEEEGSYAKVLTHYRAAVKGKSATIREIEDGRWFDTIQEGSSPDRIRSIDVFVTHTPADPNERKTVKDEPLVVEILVVEITRVAPEAAAPEKGAVGKK